MDERDIAAHLYQRRQHCILQSTDKEIWMAENQAHNTVPLQNRYSDKFDLDSKSNIGKLAFLLASVLIFLATISLAFTGLIASKEADRQALFNQEKLLAIAIENRFSLMARDQLSLARWDRSVVNISQNLNQDYVTDEFIDSLWYDFGLNHNLLIGPDDRILAESFEEEVLFERGELGPGSSLKHIVEQARANYFQYRTVLDGGYGKKRADDDSLTEASYGFLLQNSQVVMACAMPIVPDDDTEVLPDGNPVILLSSMVLAEDLIADLSDQLSFSNLQFNRNKVAPVGSLAHPVTAITGETLGVFSWSSDMPGQQIWRTVIPVIIVLGLLLAVVAFSIARKIGNLTFSLTVSEQRNYHLAMHDTLSGLANRLQVNRALETAEGNVSNIPFTLVQCDLDKFKNVNDTLGHAAGDTVIKAVAHRLTGAVGSLGLVGRVGGDEFVIVLPDCIDRTSVKALADTIITEIHKPIETETGEKAQIGISLGIAFAPADGLTAASLMAAADAALYKAKDLGRNRAIFACDLRKGVAAV